MSTSTSPSANVYSAPPAFPILASSLLPLPPSTPLQPAPRSEEEETEQTATATAAPQQDNVHAWNLKADIEDGIQTRTGTRGVFRCGVVIGFSVLRERRYGSRNGGDDFGEGREWVGELPRHLLSTLLLRKESPGTRRSISPEQLQPKAFIIYPTNSSTFAPEALLASLLSHHHRHHQNKNQPSISRDEAIELLDAVQLFPVFDFPSALQAISEVADKLHKIQQERRQREQQQPAEVDLAGDQPVLLIIEGLDALAEGVIRTSNPLRGSALLIPALRTLTHLSRTYASFLSVVLVNTSGVGRFLGQSQSQGQGQGGQQTQSRSQSQSQSQSQGPGPGQDRDGDGIHSVFFRPGMTSLLLTLLSRSLDQGLDVHLLLSIVKGRRIVEVIKDRVGASVGRWCVWDRTGTDDY
ncbi:hypothetical protein VTN00DRAFT_2315 [Thermoascus crustaceus]|uniref:uncharacterized protein n=1 Tax=Thermoascus crustaceus TaxID=5088 RepID=UPI003743C792